MNRHIDTAQLEVYDGAFPFDVNETIERMMDAALKVAYDDFTANGLGPCSGDVAPWETSTLDAIGDLLVRFAATNARGLHQQMTEKEPPEPYVLITWRTVEMDPETEPETMKLYGNDAVEWRADFARTVAGSEVIEAAAFDVDSTGAGVTLAEYEGPTAVPMPLTASERIRAAREAVEVLVHVNVTIDGDDVTATVPLAERIG